MNDAVDTPRAEPVSMPMFYKNPVPLEPGRHTSAGLRDRRDFLYARDTNAIPLTASEFAHAARTYPIVFSTTAPTVPFAVVGLRDGENLFVNAAGQWRDDSYIPAYVRRYPFIFSEITGSQQMLLCVDEGADHYEQSSSSQPFFVDGKPSEAVQRVFQFNETFQIHYADTRRFGDWLDQNDLLESNKVARAELGGGQSVTLRGFRVLNIEKLRLLTDAQVLELHKKGWLPLLHFHLQSLNNWELLGALTHARANPPA